MVNHHSFTDQNFFFLDSTLHEAVASAIEDFHNFTCVKFINRTNEPDYLEFFQGTGYLIIFFSQKDFVRFDGILGF